MIAYDASPDSMPIPSEYDNSTVGEEEHFELRHLTAALCDWQVSKHCVCE